MTSREVLVPAERLVRWFENFANRHGGPRLVVRDGRLRAAAPDGTIAEAALPWGREYDGPADVGLFRDAVLAPVGWGVLLVRKGGFAVARGTTPEPEATKVGQRHVQGRTKAGGQSQQRFARRRDNQARQAYEAAGAHAHRVLVLEAGRPLDALVCGGDRTAVEAVLSDPRLTRVADRRTGPWLAVADPRRSVLEQAVADAWSVAISVDDGD